jgi:hypothetical protein
MKANNPVSVYIVRTLPSDSRGVLKSYFEESNRLGESAWVEFSSARGSGYKQGKQVAFTFAYESNSLEVKVWIEEADDGVVISVGNSGFPFEPMLAKKRSSVIG